MGQLIWRYHPETRRYEIFAEGGGNAFGVEIDAKGRIYSGHNGGDTRGFHYVQGGYYQKGFDKHGPLSNPYAFGYFPAMKHNRVPALHPYVRHLRRRRSSRRAIAACSSASRRCSNHVVMSEARPDGSSFRTRDVGLAVHQPIPGSDRWTSSSARTAPSISPTGTTARSTTPQPRGTDRPGQRADLSTPARGAGDAAEARRTSPPSTRRLIERLGDPNKWTRQTVLRLIGDRKDAGIAPELKRRLPRSDASSRWSCSGRSTSSAAWMTRRP